MFDGSHWRQPPPPPPHIAGRIAPPDVQWLTLAGLVLCGTRPCGGLGPLPVRWLTLAFGAAGSFGAGMRRRAGHDGSAPDMCLVACASALGGRGKVALFDSRGSVVPPGAPGSRRKAHARADRGRRFARRALGCPRRRCGAGGWRLRTARPTRRRQRERESERAALPAQATEHIMSSGRTAHAPPPRPRPRAIEFTCVAAHRTVAEVCATCRRPLRRLHCDRSERPCLPTHPLCGAVVGCAAAARRSDRLAACVMFMLELSGRPCTCLGRRLCKAHVTPSGGEAGHATRDGPARRIAHQFA